MSPASKAQRKATDKYIKNTFDELKIRVPKGKKAEYQTHAESKGESLNGYVVQAINERVERDKGEDNA